MALSAESEVFIIAEQHVCVIKNLRTASQFRSHGADEFSILSVFVLSERPIS